MVRMPGSWHRGPRVAIVLTLVVRPGPFMPCTHTVWLSVSGWVLLDRQGKF